MVQEESLNALQFARDLLPSLFEMVSDSVPNVRITLAKAMYTYFSNESKYRKSSFFIVVQNFKT